MFRDTFDALAIADWSHFMCDSRSREEREERGARCLEACRKELAALTGDVTIRAAGKPMHGLVRIELLVPLDERFGAALDDALIELVLERRGKV